MKTNMIQQKVVQSGIHEFVFLTDKREAIDMYFDMVGELFECSPRQRPIRYIINWSESGVPNLNYMFLKTKEWARKHRGVANGRCVILFDQRGFMPIGKALSMLVMKDWGDDKVRIELFHADKREQAINWLLEQDTDDLATTS